MKHYKTDRKLKVYLDKNANDKIQRVARIYSPSNVSFLNQSANNFNSNSFNKSVHSCSCANVNVINLAGRMKEYHNDYKKLISKNKCLQNFQHQHQEKIQFRNNYLNKVEIVNKLIQAYDQCYDFLDEKMIPMQLSNLNVINPPPINEKCSKVFGNLKNNSSDYNFRLHNAQGIDDQEMDKLYNFDDNQPKVEEDEYENKFDEIEIDEKKIEKEEDIIEEFAENAKGVIKQEQEQREIVEEKTSQDKNKKMPSPIHTHQRNYFEDSSDKIIFDEIEHKVFKTERILPNISDEEEISSTYAMLKSIEKKTIVIQRFWRKRRWKNILKQCVSNRVYFGWDKPERNLIFIYINTVSHLCRSEITSLFVKIYSLDKLKFVCETFAVEELTTMESIEKLRLVSMFPVIIEKIVSLLQSQITPNTNDSSNEGIESHQQEKVNSNSNSNGKSSLPNLEEKRSLNKSLSSIEEIYENI